MENPEHEIRTVVRSLCQGTAEEQQRTLDRYFTKDVSFVHPFCTVPHFGEGHVPLLSRMNSRDVVRAIFQWYRMLSPKIEIEIDSALYDKARDKMYLDIRQIFSIWFVPVYQSHVRLVTVLDLVANNDPNYHDPLDRILKQEEEERDEKTAHQQHVSRDQDHRTWKISKQEDLYQVNDFLKFTGPVPLSFLWFLFQLGATAVCVFMSLFLPLSPWAYQKEPARGGVEATIERVERVEDVERVESYHDDESKTDVKAPAGSMFEEDSHIGDVKAPAGSMFEENSHIGDVKAPAGSMFEEDSHIGDVKAPAGSMSEEDTYSGGGGSAATNGQRRDSANSKASPSTPRKSWKSGSSSKRGSR